MIWKQQQQQQQQQWPTKIDERNMKFEAAAAKSTAITTQNYRTQVRKRERTSSKKNEFRTRKASSISTALSPMLHALYMEYCVCYTHAIHNNFDFIENGSLLSDPFCTLTLVARRVHIIITPWNVSLYVHDQFDQSHSSRGVAIRNPRFSSFSIQEARETKCDGCCNGCSYQHTTRAVQ